jgi:ketosteroid isomerase-like protein
MEIAAAQTDNIGVVRDYYATFNRWLASYWSDPGQPVDGSEGLEQVFSHLAEEVEWDWPLTPETFRGRAQLLRAVEDWLATVSDWRIEVEELIEGRHGKVLLVGLVLARGAISGAPVRQPVFSAITVRRGKVARIEDHTERAKGMIAAGVAESPARTRGAAGTARAARG